MAQTFEYSPFDKDLGDIDASHLSILTNVAEGWYVEYKEALVSPISIAKSVSAMANTYGGWLFYGIREDRTGKKAAGHFPGISKSEISRAIEVIAQAISAHLAPIPFYEHHVVYGPESNLGLDSDRAIIIVHIPRGNASPFVHSSGRIYRRVSDSSDPKPETDRHLLDALWQRGERAKEVFRKNFEADLPLSEDESYIKLFFFSDRWGDLDSRSSIGFKQFASIMKKSDPIPFDCIFTSNSSLVARQVQNNDIWRRGFTWEYDHNRLHKVTVPLTYATVPDVIGLYDYLNGYQYREEFCKIFQQVGIEKLKFVDLSRLFDLLFAIYKRLYDLQVAEDKAHPLWMKAQIIGIQQVVPYLDSEYFIEFLQENGIPIVQRAESIFPPGLNPDTCIEVSMKPENIESEEDDDYDEVDDSGVDAIRESFSISQGCAAAIWITNTFGIPASGLGFNLDTTDPDDRKLEFNRATTSMLRMSERSRYVADLRAKRWRDRKNIR